MLGGTEDESMVECEIFGVAVADIRVVLAKPESLLHAVDAADDECRAEQPCERAGYMLGTHVFRREPCKAVLIPTSPAPIKSPPSEIEYMSPSVGTGVGSSGAYTKIDTSSIST